MSNFNTLNLKNFENQTIIIMQDRAFTYYTSRLASFPYISPIQKSEEAE